MKVNKRRGIGTVLATAVMVFLMVFTISQLYIYGIDELDNYNLAAAQVFATQSQKLNERLSISNVALDTSGAISANILATFTVTNTGGTTSQIVAVWVDNVDQSTSPHKRVSENIFLGQGLSTTISNLDTGIPKASLVKMTLKVVTALGNSVSVALLPPGLAGTTTNTLAQASLTVVPPNPITSNTISVLMTITNNNLLGVTFTSLAPDICIVQGKVAPLVGAADSGQVTVATSSSTGPLTDGTRNWGTNVWAGYVVVITGGTGQGQTKTIVSNLQTTLTIAGSWTTNPDTDSTYSIQNNCHNATPAVFQSTATSVGTSTTLTDINQNWSTNKWTNYNVVIVSGTGKGQLAMIASNTATQLTVPSGGFTTPPDTTSKYAIRANICNSGTGLVSLTPVGCITVQSASPSTLSSLPFGATAIFQWQYTMNTIIADSPVTFTTGYVNITTTANLITSQAPSSLVTVRGPGGATASSGGNLQQALGSLINYFSSLQFTSDGNSWSSGYFIPTGPYLMFRVNVTNLDSRTIAFNSTTQMFLLDLSTGASTEFYITRGCVTTQPFIPSAPPHSTPSCSSGGAVTFSAYPGATSLTSRYLVGPGQTITLYFGATAAGGTARVKMTVAGRNYLGILVMVGSTMQGSSTTASANSNQFSALLNPVETGSNYQIIFQPGWSAGTITYPTKTASTFTAQFTAPTSASTASWGVYCVSPCTYSTIDHSPFSQSAPFFAVGT